MIVKAIKTHKITPNEDLYQIIDKYLPQLEEKSVVVITSKIVSICMGDIIKNNDKNIKKELIKQEADWYYEDDNLKRFGLVIPTIKNNIIIANAGIDESNANANLILWPKNLRNITNNIWEHLKQKHKLKEVGVLITDSRLTPMRFGLTGLGLSWCGFAPLKDYRGEKDIFNREMKMSQLSIIDGLASTAGVVMGEGSEQTPIATITDISFVTFQNHVPTKKEINNLNIEREDDVYGKLLTSIKWTKGVSEK